LRDVVVCEVEPGDSPTAALEGAAPADVVLVRPGCRFAPDWLDGLRDAAYASATTATATALTQHDLELAGHPFEPAAVEPAAFEPAAFEPAAFEPAAFEQAAAAVRTASLRLRPRIESPGSACVYVRRSALELIGDAPDPWTRCVEQGLAHVLADDVLVLEPQPAGPRAHEATAAENRATGAARRALHGLAVTIDARILSGPTTGTHVHVLELIAGLARSSEARITAILPDQPSQDARERLGSLPRVNLTTYREAVGGADVVHRPFQLSNAGDLSFLESLGERLILTQQDLIAFHNPAYFPTRGAWHDYRHLTNIALATADRVVFFSAHTRDDALAEQLVDPGHAGVVHLGVDHSYANAPEAPPGAERIAGDAMLCLGTDFLHKNRVFALRILERLRTEHGWTGTLVFAGPAVAHGSSRPLEARFLAEHPGIADRVLDLGAVSEPQKHWLYDRATLVLYPSALEGFGLVPFEAASHGVPCLWAPGSSLSELLPDEVAGIVPWNDRRSAEHALALMNDHSARERNVSAIDAAAQSLTWDTTANRLLDAYRATADAPARIGTGAGIVLSEDAARLVGPGGELPQDVQRPLLALATHPRIADPVFGALKLGYRASARLRRGGQSRK